MALWPAANVAGHCRAIVKRQILLSSRVLGAAFKSCQEEAGVGSASCKQSEAQETLDELA